MDTVTVFNDELSTVYEARPPISKAKMASITRSAMKAIKFYKHVVQSVEKFIQKCKPEYKVPGLYVIDSIVRQSRHQYGAEKDVFAPRFARNMQSTFANLFRCSPDEKSKIIRVLNLWQKNCVFAPEVIQPLFDLADPNHPIYQNQNIDCGSSAGNMTMTSQTGGGGGQDSPPANMIDDGHTMSSDMSGPIMQTPNQLDSSTIRQLQQLQQFLLRQTGNEPSASTSTGGQSDSVKFNKKLLDYDYGDEEEEDKPQTPRPLNIENNNISQLLNDSNIVLQLQTLQKLKQQEEKQSKLTEMRIQEEAFEKHLATVLKKLPFANECDLSRTNNDPNQLFGMQSNITSLLQQTALSTNVELHAEPEVEFISEDGKVEVINLDGNSRSPSIERDRYNKRRRTRSRSRDRFGGGGGGGSGGGRSRRRSRSRSRSPRSRRRGSRDRDRDRERTKDKERDREKEREYERERRKKGLPDIKKEHLSVCSTTLWVGHLSKLVQQEELSDTFMKYGDIVSIDMIHPRGCAFIVMNRRQDAYKAMGGLKNYKLQGRVITISWAAGKGVKSKEWKDYWDLDLGVSYIPWNKLQPTTDFETLEEGGMFDEDSMPEWLKEKLKASNQRKDSALIAAGAMYPMADLTGSIDTTQPPPGAGGAAGPPSLMQSVTMVPPYQMGSVPRLLPPPGMHMLPNIVTGLTLGVPPPQMNPQMMMATGSMVPPGLSHLSLDKSVPPPSTGAATANTFMGHYPPPIPGPMPPQMAQHIPQIPTAPATTNSNNNNSNNNNSSDDHMDIDNDDEPTTIRATGIPNPLMGSLNVGPFSRPPPQMFGGQNTLINLTPEGGTTPDGRDRRRDRSNSKDRQSHDRDFRGGSDRSRDRERTDRDRDRRNDFGRDRDRNSRWGGGGDRDRSRENDLTNRDRRTSRERDRNMRNRNDRDKPLPPPLDCLRDIGTVDSVAAAAAAAAAAAGRCDFTRRGDTNDWRDVSAAQPSMGNNAAMNAPFLEQAIRNIRPLNLGQLGGPPPLTDLMHNARGMPPRDFEFPRDDFDRRGPPRDFFVPNRFGPPQGQPRPMPLLSMRAGPPPAQFGNRMGAPMFMRNNNRGGPSGQQGFNDRQFYDRDAGGMRGGRGENRRGTGGGGGGRSNWNGRDDEQKSTNRFAAQKDEQQQQRISSPPSTMDPPKQSTRWGNVSPKSVVSDEENWDDDAKPKSSPSDSANNNNNNNNNNTTITTTTTITSTKENELHPQTEIIDDDSQEDDFNDYDENAPDVNELDTIQNTQQQQQNDDFDMFADDTSTNAANASAATDDSCNLPSKSDVQESNCHQSGNDVHNTTPLYDELHDEANAANKIATKSYANEEHYDEPDSNSGNGNGQDEKNYNDDDNNDNNDDAAETQQLDTSPAPDA